MFHHVFSAADHPFGNHVLNVLIGIIAVLFQNADPEQMINEFLRFFFTDAVPLSELFCRASDPALLETEHEPDFFLGEHPVKNPEIHVVFMHSSRQLAGNIVRDHAGKLHDEFFLFRIITVIIRVGKITFIDVNSRIDFSWHDCSPVQCNRLR